MAKSQTPAEEAQALDRIRLDRQKAEGRSEIRRLAATGADAHMAEVRDERGRRKVVIYGRRKDAFQVLFERGSISERAFLAIRRHEEDLALAAGHLSPERTMGHVRGSTEGAPGQNVTQAMIEASWRVRWAEERLSTRDRKLLEALRANHHSQWRALVQTITGETRDECHATCVRAMAENLADAQERGAKNDYGRRKAA